MTVKISCFSLSAILVVISFVVGCGAGDSKSVAAYNKTNIQKLRNAYSIYATTKGKPPADEESLKEFLKTDEGTRIRLGRMGISVEEVDEIFVSERDQLAFKIRWKISGPKDHAIIFEAEGVDGMRMVAFYEPRELDEDEYNRHWNGEVQPEF